MAKSYKDNLELQWPLRRIFQLNKIIHLKGAPGSKNLQSKQTEQGSKFINASNSEIWREKKIISNTTFDLRIVPVFPFFENENQNSLTTMS